MTHRGEQEENMGMDMREELHIWRDICENDYSQSCEKACADVWLVRGVRRDTYGAKAAHWTRVGASGVGANKKL